MIQASPSKAPALNELLAQHPFVEVLGEPISDQIEFLQNGKKRRVVINDLSLECHGLVELDDNNPMVCADAVSVPGPGETLALIALGPLAKAQLLLESPIILTNVRVHDDLLEAYLYDLGWDEGFFVNYEEVDFGEALVLNVLAKLKDPHADLDALFEECYGRSFFVRRDQDSEWDTQLVAASPFALYRLVRAEDLVRVQVMADRNGKAGAAQLVHAMNVMCGFEESLPF
ncbi:MAG: hypothetical protein JNK63_07310 [Chthonomonas sp.]|nr:hypothetical protein [Chthonomonas sp.]